VKPVLNLDELELEHVEEGAFAGRWSAVGEKIGAKLLGYNLTVVPPGKQAVPYHNHRNNEEMFLILDGTGTLRFGDKEHDIVACPPGDRSVAHQIINSGTTDLVYLALSTMNAADIWEYPDSNKIGVNVSGGGLRKFYRAETDVDYWDRETR
jgi:uncharacterized cupin superfamily protein